MSNKVITKSGTQLCIDFTNQKQGSQLKKIDLSSDYSNNSITKVIAFDPRREIYKRILNRLNP